MRALFAAAVSGVAVGSPPDNTATDPVPGDATWRARHLRFVARAKKGGIDLLFLGDSITDFWRTRGRKIWKEFYASRRAANFGINGDRTQHLLWRIEHGELDGLQPRLVVLLIGTNNIGWECDRPQIRNTPPQVIQGVRAVVRAVRRKLPASRLLLLALFPRGPRQDPQRAQIVRINRRLAGLEDGKRVRFLDLGPRFLEPDGALSPSVMPDGLHLSAQSYGLWAEAMEPILKAMLR